MKNSRCSPEPSGSDGQEKQIGNSGMVEKLTEYVLGQIGTQEIRISIGDVLRLEQFLAERRGLEIREVTVRWVDESSTGGVS